MFVCDISRSVTDKELYVSQWCTSLHAIAMEQGRLVRDCALACPQDFFKPKFPSVIEAFGKRTHLPTVYSCIHEPP